MTVTALNLSAADLQRFCCVPGPGEVTPEMVRLHAPDALLVFTEDNQDTARASLWWSRVPGYGAERIGLVGHYAADQAGSAARIIAAACATLADQGCTLAVGPMDGNTWRRYRLLTERGPEPPFFLEPDNPDDWPLHFADAGFVPLARYYSALNEDIRRPWPLRPATGFRIRRLDPGRIREEMQRLWAVSTGAFARNFLYTPIDEPEFHAMHARLLPLVRPELVLIAEEGGRPVGFCFAIPDVLQARRGDPVDTVIVKTLAVLPECQGRGLGSLLIARVNETAAELGMRRSIHALMHEANASRRIGRGFMRDFRRYTLFAKPL